MLKNKLTSFILALSMTATAVVSVSAYAVPKHESWGDEFISEEFADCIKLEDYDMFISDYSSTYNVAMYMYQHSPDQTALYNVYCIPDTIRITIPEDEALLDEVIAKAEGVNENLKLCSKSSYKSKTSLWFKSKDSDGSYISTDMKDASAFFELIKDDVVEYSYTTSWIGYDAGFIDDWSAYRLESVQNKGVEIQAIQDFLDSEKIEAEISVNEETVNIIPSNEISLEEHYQLAQKLYKEFKITPSGIWLDVVNMVLADENVDMKNAVKGDANGDSKVTLADATAILQALGNPDKYGLSIQGEYNADVYGNGDGVTAMDAIAIQEYEAKIIDSF